MKVIVCTLPDGRMRIRVPAPKYLERFPSEEAALESLKSKHMPEGTKDIAIIDESDLPRDRSFRNAWERDTSASPAPVKVNLAKAKAVTKQAVRESGADPDAFNIDGAKTTTTLKNILKQAREA